MADETNGAGVQVKAEPTQSFVATRRVIASNGSAEPGGEIELTRAEHKELSALGAVEGAWKGK